jgi:hypothetical protein
VYTYCAIVGDVDYLQLVKLRSVAEYRARENYHWRNRQLKKRVLK